ncbi:porin family protein [Chelativorans sp. SCAU2101]|jgi:Opacity protein and related surface antigens|uniref:Porin family protein n=1 Tax=Chelativorans petroleitrophicus TaxID=2975484 RepID=A0A9X2XAT2_9HYPH|nr:outer membrane protein [Chelativorans petroleitrophicus]MCT8990840.1 porin family protein [Chelativorans petroleitrophicus]
MNANRKKIVGIAAAAALASVAIPAYAADVVYEQPPAPPAAPMEVAPVATWAGPYAGVALGYGFNGSTEATNAAGVTNDIDTDGFVGNAFAGWNWQSGSFVYGVEGDIGYNGMDGDNAGLSTEGGVDGTIRARLGFAATDNVLVYGTAGGAGGRHELSDATSSDDQTLWGWTAGAGVDVKVTDQSFARLEYRYTDLGSETFSLASGDYDVDVTSHKVLVGFGMSF